MKIGSLFSGIGGIELGLRWAGVGDAVWHVEQDPFCRAVLDTHWPGVPCYQDVCKVGAHNLERVDVLCGGFPCQDISTAGLGAGLKGARSGLWFEYARIIEEIRPRFVVIENVAALLRRGLDVVLQDLAARGYDAEWSVLRASDVGRVLGRDEYGARHRRERIFVIAWLADAFCGGRVGVERVVTPVEGERQAVGRLQQRAELDVGDREPTVADAARVQPQSGDQRAGADAARHSSAGDVPRRSEARALLADAASRSGPRQGGGLKDRGRPSGEVERAGLLAPSRSQGHHRGTGCFATTSQEALGCVGGRADGLPTRLDVARPGEEQRAWEAPRVVAQEQDRAKRLRALGNAVVPHAAMVVGLRLLQIQSALERGEDP